jgi:thioredoxin-related protein
MAILTPFPVTMSNNTGKNCLKKRLNDSPKAVSYPTMNILRTPLLLIASFGLTLNACAAEEGWLTDLDAGLKAAAEAKKHVMVEFTGSDWCPPCMKMHKEIFSQEDFVKKASEKFILVKLDFPNKKEQSEEEKKANQAAAEKFGIKGFPTVLILDSEGKEVDKQVGYSGAGLDGFLEWLMSKAE